MLIPYNADVPMERVPIANWILIGTTCLVSITPVWLLNNRPARTATTRGAGGH